MTTMTAVVQDRYGADATSVLTLEESPSPEIGAGEVLEAAQLAANKYHAWNWPKEAPPSSTAERGSEAVGAGCKA